MAITNSEYEVFAAFCLDRGIEVDGEVGQKNGALFGNYLNSKNQGITQANLQAAFDAIKTTLTFVNPIQAEYNRLASYFTEPERDRIGAFINQQGLDIGGDALLRNWSILAQFLIENKAAFQGKTYSGQALEATPQNLAYALSKIQASPKGQHLIWRTRQPQGKKFNAEEAVKAQAESR